MKKVLLMMGLLVFGLGINGVNLFAEEGQNQGQQEAAPQEINKEAPQQDTGKEASQQEVGKEAVPQQQEGASGTTQAAAPSVKEQKVIFSFEKSLEGWELPDWVFEKQDFVARNIRTSDKYASEGHSSLEMEVAFPGGIWTAAYVEIMSFFDWTGWDAVAMDVYLPQDAPNGLKAKPIVTVGEDWKWVEGSRATKLEPGQWVTVEASLTPDSTDWRGTTCDEKFVKDVRKYGIRIESNMRPVYSGKIYIDNVRIIKHNK